MLRGLRVAIAALTTNSSSTKAFSVTYGLGKLRSPRGKALSVQKPRT
jgi:hypothetical protein